MKRDIRKLKYLVLHCTGTSNTATVQAITGYWKNTLFWSDGGYAIITDREGINHFYVVKRDGYEYSTDPSHFKESLQHITNGVKGYNSEAIHIAYIGGLHGDDRSALQKSSQVAIIKDIIDIYPHLDILGHRDLSNDKNNNGIISPDEWQKLCPSMDTIHWLNESGIYTYLLSKKK